MECLDRNGKGEAEMLIKLLSIPRKIAERDLLQDRERRTPLKLLCLHSILHLLMPSVLLNSLRMMLQRAVAGMVAAAECSGRVTGDYGVLVSSTG